jgi:diguanylate cyclase (GGDEF)-like protein/putative nucleotidyltransferase with HDIG domain
MRKEKRLSLEKSSCNTKYDQYRANQAAYQKKPSNKQDTRTFPGHDTDGEVLATLTDFHWSIDLNKAADEITSKVPKLFQANKCSLFVQEVDSGGEKLVAISKHNCRNCSNACALQEKDIREVSYESSIYHDGSLNTCNQFECQSPHLLINISVSDSEQDIPGDSEQPASYLCMCEFSTSYALDMRQISYKAKLIRGILGAHLHNARLYERARQASLTDPMTGVGSRKFIEDELESEYVRLVRYGRPFSIAMIDLDNFKTINDILGHTAGDDALKKLAECIRNLKRNSDALGRYGGDEFLILMPETNAWDASVLLERLREKTKQIKLTENLSMTISCGIAQSCENSTSMASELVRRADLALYEAKSAGKDCVKVWDTNMSKQLSESDLEIEKIKKLQRRIAGLSEKSEKMFIQSIWGLVQALEAKDPYSMKHSEHVMHYSVCIAEAMGLFTKQIEIIRHAAMLHDIGKIGVPDAILFKPNTLTSRERSVMERHPLIAVRILEKMTFLERELDIIRHHHERWNGQGYPDGLAGMSIPLGARILTVADALDAITSHRSYRQSRSVSEAVEILADSAGYDFDPGVINGLICWMNTILDGAGSLERLTPDDLCGARTSLASASAI